jgi:hypothetical protein
MSGAHRRFQEWLTAGAEGSPARDLAVHASVCPTCRQSIAALDSLAIVDPGLARMPVVPAAAQRGGLVRAGRLTSAAAGVMLSAVILGIGASQLIALTRNSGEGPVALASQTPNQGVLGGKGTPQPSVEGSPTSPAKTMTPLPTATPTLVPTPRPTSRPTPRPTPHPTPKPTPKPTPTPIPTPGTPVLDVPSWNTISVDLSWSTPAGGPISQYEVWRSGTQAGTYVLIVSQAGTTYPDGAVMSGSTYYYKVRAVGAGGTGSYSTEQSVTVP